VARQKAVDRAIDGRPELNNWCLEEEQEDQAKDLWIAPNLMEEDPYVVVELPSFYMVSVQVSKGNEWAYFSAFMDSYLGENAWIAVFERCGEFIPWFGSAITPKKDQLIVVRMLKEEECSWEPWQHSTFDATAGPRYSSWEDLLWESLEEKGWSTPATPTRGRTG
jgi:hypothetical protein